MPVRVRRHIRRRERIHFGRPCIVPRPTDLEHKPNIAPDDIAGAIRFLQQEYMQANHWRRPSQINSGNCDYFASDITDLIPDAHLQCSDDKPDYLETEWAVGHCWVEYRGKHYDAEAPDGVGDWKKLPLFVRARRKR